jgi:hypothetical protein
LGLAVGIAQIFLVFNWTDAERENARFESWGSFYKRDPQRLPRIE